MVLVVTRAGSMLVSRASVVGKKASDVAEVTSTEEWSVKTTIFGGAMVSGAVVAVYIVSRAKVSGDVVVGSVVLVSGSSMAMNIGDWVVKSCRVGVDYVDIHSVEGWGVEIYCGGG